MRIQFAAGRWPVAYRRALSRCSVAVIVAASALGAGACANTQTAQPESRLGARGDDYRWSGRGARQTYRAKGLDGTGGRGSDSGPASAAGDTVYFTSDSTDLTAEAQATLGRLAGQMRSRPAGAVAIEGHADERGTREYNLALGARRAAAVKAYLLSKGMLDAQVRTISFGKERPVATCDDISCWTRNRRAQVLAAGG